MVAALALALASGVWRLAFGVWRLAFEQRNQPDFRRNNNPDTTIITIGGNAYAIR